MHLEGFWRSPAREKIIRSKVSNMKSFKNSKNGLKCPSDPHNKTVQRDRSGFFWAVVHHFRQEYTLRTCGSVDMQDPSSASNFILKNVRHHFNVFFFWFHSEVLQSILGTFFSWQGQVKITRQVGNRMPLIMSFPSCPLVSLASPRYEVCFFLHFFMQRVS